MHSFDMLLFSMKAATANRSRTILTLIAMTIGVSSVIILISLGDSARRYVVDQFSSLGSNLLIILPGRTETVGGPPPLLGETPRDLTLDDTVALTRSTAIRRIAPIVAGSAPVSVRQLEREMMVIGATAELLEMRHLAMSQGRFLPPGDPTRGTSVCIIGSTGRKELFGSRQALGQWLRIGDRRFKVIGILGQTGMSMGDDMGEVVIIPVASAQALFNTESLFRVLVEASSPDSIDRAREAILTIIRTRHDGEDDVTVISQGAILATFDRIFRALTLSVAGIAAISLVVAGIMIMNIMLVSVSNRRVEIGLLKALGSTHYQIMGLFLTESALLSLTGSAIGFLLSIVSIELAAVFFPEFSLQIAPWSLGFAFAVALTTGIAFGVLPARRAARLEAALALAQR